MEVKPANREWVKTAAIVFLAVLLVLTFFSKTISNRLLTEVATAGVQSGTITAKVRGSGTVTANGSHEVKATQTREVGTVLVKVGQEVKVGDVLFTMGAGDSEELEAAYEALQNLQQSYKVTALGMPQYNYGRLERAYSNAELRREEALDERDAAQLDLEKALESNAAKAAAKRIDTANEKLDELQEAYNALLSYLTAQQELQELQAQLLDGGLSPEAIEYINEQIAEEMAVMSEQNEILAPKGIIPTEERLADVIKNIEAEEKNLNIYQAEYNRLVGNFEQAYLAAEGALNDVENEYYEASYALESAMAADQQTASSVGIQLEGLSRQIAAQQEKIKSLAGEGGESILSNVEGTVQSVSVTSGNKVAKGDVMCVIEVEDMGYTVSFSVTNDQAKRLRIGDSAKVSNFYWGNEIIATLTSMVNDPKAPQTNKMLTFDIKGDVKSGDQLTVSVGSKSAGYDLVIPNSSIRSDTNGSFVLAIEAKNSPIGNRYIAKRVNIEVIASDDENSAVTGAISNGDFVITTTSAPVKSGDQVRLSDSNK